MSKQAIASENTTREKIYKTIFPQIKALTEKETNLITNMANTVAMLKESLGFFWVGFYLVDSPQELVLGPFQGPVACTRITKGKGVCGTCWKTEKTIIVPDVNLFPGHIACSYLSKSEIVLPVYINKTIKGILDIDSNQFNDFTSTDEHYLSKILTAIF